MRTGLRARQGECERQGGCRQRPASRSLPRSAAAPCSVRAGPHTKPLFRLPLPWPRRVGRVHPHRVEGSFCGGGQYRARSQPPRKVHGLSAWSCTRALLPAGGRVSNPVWRCNIRRGAATARPAARRRSGNKAPAARGCREQRLRLRPPRSRGLAGSAATRWLAAGAVVGSASGRWWDRASARSAGAAPGSSARMRAGQEPADRRLHVRKSGCDVDETEEVTRVSRRRGLHCAHGPFRPAGGAACAGARCGGRGLLALPGS